jgi:NAD(P)-dependent dehydrogenase (short-subunit alcohol dehydrogenase family)
MARTADDPAASAPTVELGGRAAWVTGAAGGFGAAVARRLARAGARVMLSDVRDAEGKAVAAELGCDYVNCDVTSLADCERAVAATVERFGTIDLAFLNAGVITGCSLADDFDPDRYRRAVSINVDGVVFGAQAAFGPMSASGGGDIVATASLAGLIGTAFDPVYSMTKHAVVGLVRSIGDDWPRFGIRVNALCPGFADTPIVDPLREILRDSGIPLIPVEMVVDAFVAAATSGRSGECWYVQPGRPGEPFRFRGVPGPRPDDEPAP